ncbi:hypothetical protein XM53_11560 [Roseovarius atlanticus]|uniref:Sulfotransferase domain-containing protein n=1 Tax=Roseovarius atlanticus TaxID=1641875 RepID=A0A0T5NU24_9RHOB|nr:hypothetical protein [Roseovarius atlanticus]KRS12421.1 hypothetical protein XM53_11560 [Roseovarius atlanticus]
MDVVLHIGAHRTATTTFQSYLAQNRAALGRMGVTVWGPKQTRDGLLTGVMPVDSPRPPQDQLDRARARIAINVAKERRAGTRVLVISDENMIGAPRRCLRQGRLYPDIGQRLARFAHAFDGQVTRACLSIRSHDSFWASVVSYGVARGHRVPDRAVLDALATSPRLWRDVVLDVACALPGIELSVLPYEIFGGLPERVLEHMSGLGPMPRAHARDWMNQGPGLGQLRRIVRERGGDPARLPEGPGKWQPFDETALREMREAYADDLFWLRAGAEGLAQLTEETGPVKTGTTPRPDQRKRGQDDGIEDRRLA